MVGPAQTARMLLLAAEVERDWAAVGLHSGRAASADPRHGEAQAALCALSLDHAYQAFETLLIRLERALGLPARVGDAWHRQLVADAAMPIAGLREALIPQASLRHWDALRRFRHFLRHAYATELDATELLANTEHLKSAFEHTAPEIARMLDQLRATATSADG